LNVGPTPYYIEIYDLTDGMVLMTCGSGIICSIGDGPDLGQSITFVAYITPLYVSAPPPPEVQATSAQLTVTWSS